MPSIADVSVLLPLLCAGHVAEKSAYAWFDDQPPASIHWCLPIRLAILRHLSNKHVMGSAVLEPTHALDVWDQLENDERLTNADSTTPQTEHLLRLNVSGRSPSPKLWTDAYLAALAESNGHTMVTFDKGFQHFHLTSLQLLEV